MGQPVIHFEIMTKDPESLSDFYKKAFDWKINDHAPAGTGIHRYMIAQPTHEDFPERCINGGIGQAPEGYDGHTTFYIAVDDVEQALQTVEKLGGKRMMGPDEVPGAGITIGLFTDPQDHTVGLVKVNM